MKAQADALLRRWKELQAGVITRAALTEDSWELIVSTERGTYRLSGPLYEPNAAALGVKLEKI